MHKDASASRRPILGTSVPFGGRKKRRCAAHHPSRYLSFNRRGTRRASIGGKAHASRSLRHRINSRSPAGRAPRSLRERRDARCASHSPLLPWRRAYRYKFGVGGGCHRSLPDRPGLASLDTRSIAGPFVRSVQVAGTIRRQMSLPDELARSLASFVQIPSIDPNKYVRVAPQP